MEKVQESIENVISAGIRAYIGLLGCGERERSRRLFKDTLEISALLAGGPSARISLRPGVAEPQTTAICMMRFALRSMLATLLVLKASPYWQRVPILDELRDQCTLVAEGLEDRPPAGQRRVLNFTLSP